jgi:uncharacterized membrane protein YdjX (TVP38/TMEM64 family)
MTNKLKLAALAVVAIGVLVLAAKLPIRDWLGALSGRIEALGLWGPVVFGALYAVATVLLVPASVLTIGAGAIFGLLTGFLTVSAASTAGAGIAFLVARYLARERVEKMAQGKPRFAAIDAAIADGGWKVVALTRLSPAIPFNLQNYLFGLTSIRFGPYLLTSWLAMMPGTLLYVYIGHLTGAAVGGDRQRTTGEWVLLGAGLLATVALTWYLTRRSRQRLSSQIPEEEAEDRSGSASS